MEPQFNTSFIPKKSLQEDVGGTTPGKYVNRRSVHGSGFYLMLLIFIITLIGAVSIFFYTKIIQERIDEKRTRLERARSAYKPEVIEELKRVDNRMKGAYLLATGHPAVSGFLNTLEAVTLKTVRYSKMELSTGGIGPAEVMIPAQVSVSGDARDLRSVALQVDELQSSAYVKNTIVNKLERSTIGGALFTLQAQLDPILLRYTTVLDMKLASPPVTIPEEVLLEGVATSSEAAPLVESTGTTTTPSATAPTL